MKDIILIINFLNRIGIELQEAALPKETFLPGLHLQGDTILLDPNQLKYPGDLLHEAGHIAVTEASLRPLIGTDKMPETWPTQGDEMASILWSYAACVHLGLDLSIVFHPAGYKKDADWLIEQFSTGNYLGLPLLEWMGLCNEQDFPKMERWLRQ